MILVRSAACRINRRREYLRVVILVVPNLQLEGLICSPALLAQLWPHAYEEVRMLIQILRMSAPTLAEALAIGLISIRMPAAETVSPEVSLEYESTVLSALAGGAAGEPVPAPHLRPSEVRRLEITDLLIGGSSALRRAG
jgi:hypothetical protein